LALPICAGVPLPLDNWKGWLLLLGLAAYDAGILLAMRAVIVPSRWGYTLTFMLLFVSPLPLLFAARAAEHRYPWDVLDPSRQSWAFMFGGLALAGLVTTCARSWVTVKREVVQEYERGWWLGVSALIGLALTVAFRWHEAGAYDLLRYDSITKLVFDLVCFFLLATLTVFAGWPVMIGPQIMPARRHRISIKGIVAALLVIWLATVVYDAFIPPDKSYMHHQSPTTAAKMAHEGDPLAANACRRS
jgi:hypothetical protein